MEIVLIILSVLLLGSIIYILRLRKDLRQINQSLSVIKKGQTNMRLRTETFDKEVVELAGQINEILDQQKKLVMESEKLNREFRQGLTNLSHDLRTPLTSMVGYVQMVRSGKIGQDKQEEYLAVIESRLQALTALMKELFDYTQLIEGRVEVNWQRVNVCSLLRDQLLIFYGDFEEKGFAVEIEFPKQDVYLMSDPALLTRIVQNLFKNVLVHGKEVFHLKVEAEQIIISNKTANGEKIEVSRLFERFYTRDASRSSKRTGLGLAITQKFLAHLGGEIKADLKGNILSFTINLQAK